MSEPSPFSSATFVDSDVAAMTLKLLPLSHQNVLRDKCAGALSGAVPPTDSVLRHFVNKDLDTSTFKCVFHEHGSPCKYTAIKRFSRALAHVRRHLNLRNFRCSGACGKGLCDMAFFSRADLNSHKYHAGRHVQCALCGARILKKNQGRHRQSGRCRSRRT